LPVGRIVTHSGSAGVAGSPVDDRGRVRPRRVFSSAEDERRFWRDGFVVSRLFDPPTMDRLRSGFDELHPADEFRPAPELSSQYHCTFLDIDLSYRRDVDLLARRILDPLLPSVLPDYDILTTNVYVKPPGTGRFEVHLNWITVDDPLETTLTIWIPLEHTDVENGTIHVVPGSHKLYPDVASATAEQYFASFHNELISSHLQPLELEPGQAVIFDDTLIHWSTDNLSDTARVAVQVELVPRDAVTAIWIPDPADRRWFILYEMDTNFWLTQRADVFYGTPDLRPIRRMPNPNREVSYQEFADRLARADEVRAMTYALPMD
jgi:hypothetical protein